MHAAAYDIDPRNVVVWGRSGSGDIAAIVGTTKGVRQVSIGDSLGQSSDVRAVVDEFGPSDLSNVGVEFDSEIAMRRKMQVDSLADPVRVAAAPDVSFVARA